MDPNILIGIAVVLSFVAVAGVGLVFAGANSSASRVKRVQAVTGAGTQREKRTRVRAAVANPDARRKQIVKSLKTQERQQKKARLTLQNRLLQAGLSITTVHYYAGSGVVAIVVMLLALLAHQPALMDVGAGAIAGFLLPRLAIGFLAKRRTKQFTEAFSDAMDIIVRGVRSGLPVNDCLRIIARESTQPLAGEFQRLVENLGMGMDFDSGLEKMCERMPTNELRFFSIVMGVQAKAGGNLAEALGNLSAVLRARKLMREKVKALSAEATASAMIIGCLPPGVVILISTTQPQYMVPLFTDPRGKLILLGCAIWMSIGIFVMRRMINFKM